MLVDNSNQILKEKLSATHYNKLAALENPKLHAFVAEAIELTNPDSVFVCTDAEQDAAYIRQLAITSGEEKALATAGHTIHFDGYYDQARDKPNTKYLLAPDTELSAQLNSIDKKTGTEEVRSFLRDSMKGRQMLVAFFCLGPTNSDFSIPAVQITDSAYVAHSEFILYRPGYEQFRQIGASEEFFRFIHSQGELENGVSKNIDRRRVYIDLEADIVYSVNTQYGGNTIGLKKPALRLAINKALREGWLAEHMFVMGVHGPAKRVTYFAGAFPSACGKTSTAMIPGQTIIGDDIAYFRKKNGRIYAANVERGIFGIIRDVNSTDDPVIYEAISHPGEAIFSNILVSNDGRPYWLGMGCEMPAQGANFSGSWHAGKKDKNGSEIGPAHRNARYTVSIYNLKNCDPLIDSPKGAPLSAIIYGGRDSDTCVPLEQAFDWVEGIIVKGAALESETTAATLGKEGVRTFNPMSNIDFVSVPLGRYIKNNLDFAKDLENPPAVFSVNYFLKDRDGTYLNGMADKNVWILWAELRVNGDVDAIKTPTGFIPKYHDLETLFKDQLAKQYSQQDYIKQFTIRTPQLLAKIDRIENIYRTQVSDTPKVVIEVLSNHRLRLSEAAGRYGEHISPFDLETK